MAPIRKSAVIFALLALFGSGCGGGSDSSSTISYRPFDLPVERKERNVEEFLKPSKNGLVGPELKPIIPDRPPPEFLFSVDLIDGFSASTVSPGDRVTVQYVGVDYRSKKKFASSWDEGKPFTFTYGEGEVIEGWEVGLERAEASDRRELVVPPDLATGGTRMNGIPKNSTLVFVIEVLKIKDA